MAQHLPLEGEPSQAGQAYLQRVASGTGGALAQRLLPALVAGQAVDLVVDAVARCVIAVHKQLPAGRHRRPSVRQSRCNR